ncbi:unnamed protein product [Chrysodeixis includens]|uniref:Uncharacterized protein n=1 Tax=Chrysodeixis includens TaxID=689277 RepID=A0A9N8KYS8_CHRIL|nr:unnamed protein product [Chrysodeixis includens]
MAAKSILVLCASACLVKMFAAQCIGANNIGLADELAMVNSGLYGAGLGYGANLAYGGNNAGYFANIAPTSGGGFAVTSSSPIAPTGIQVFSENAIEGSIAINGQLPFLGAIAVEGALPTAGAGAINYGCGSGAVGIVNEGVAGPVGPAGPVVGPTGPLAGPYGTGYAPNLAGLGYSGLGAGYNRALPCGAVY